MNEKMGLEETVRQNYEILVEEKRKWLDEQTRTLKKQDSQEDQKEEKVFKYGLYIGSKG